MKQRSHDVLHPEADACQLEVDQPDHLARMRVGQQVGRREVPVDDLDRQPIGAWPPLPRATGRRGDRPGLLGVHPGLAQLGDQGIGGRVLRPDPPRVGAPVPEGDCQRHVR